MATKQRIVYGATSEWGAASESLTPIPECKGIAVPAVEPEYQDATHLQSPNGYREFVPGLKDAGTIEIPCGYSTAGYKAANDYLLGGALVHFQTTMPKEEGQSAGDTFVFTGYVTPRLETNDIGEIIAMTLAVRISGEPVFTEGETS